MNIIKEDIKITEKKFKILGLINARGGSKRMPKKNIRLLYGKPLIYYAIKAGLDSKLIDRVIVSTEDNEIAKISLKCGAEVPFKRPKKLAGDNVTQFPPTRHAVLELRKQGWCPDIIVLLMANGPFKNGRDVDRAIQTLINSCADSARSVCKVFTHPFWSYLIDKDNLLTPFVEDVKMEDPQFCISQNLPKIYQLTGLIDVIWTKTIFNTNSLFGKKIKPLLFSQIKSIDIDTPLDLMLAETIIKKHKFGNKSKGR